MAQTSRHGGPSLTPEESADPESPQPVRVRRAEIGFVDRPAEEDKEESSSAETDGTGSSQSSEKAKPPTEPVKPPARKHARPAVSRSKPTAQGSDAHSTDGDGQSNETAPSRKARSRTTDDVDFDEF